jgi:uracil-DNA glycosylase family protein
MGSSALSLESVDKQAAQPLADTASRAETCRRCDLWRDATQTVFGERPESALIVLVGEQPGNQEDLIGRPLVGPAGKLLDEALVEAGLVRDEVYVTNAVKHFKFEPRGKRRIHRNPSAGEIDTYRWWLDLELSRLRPRVVVLLGASAARAVLRRAVTIRRLRGQPIPLDDLTTMVAVHPSWLLRMPDRDAKTRERARFVSDLRTALGLTRSTAR